MNEALRKVEKWCNDNHLSINPGKTVIVPFTKKRNLRDMQQLKLYGKVLEVSKDVKYLGVTLDKELNWKKHVDLIITKALRVFGMCRSAYGKTW